MGNFTEYFEQFKTADRVQVASALIMSCSRKELDQIQEILEHEIDLSDKTIEEGYEDDDRE